MKKAIAALVTLLLICIALFPSLAIAQSKAVKTPAGYNEHDFNKIRAFFETADENGLKNGQKLNPESYDPDDPTTWETPGDSMSWKGVRWMGAQAFEFRVAGLDMYGVLDLSGCTMLSFLECEDNRISKINVSGCSSLWWFVCERNQITELDVSRISAYCFIACGWNNIKELDLSECSVAQLFCQYNQLTELNIVDRETLMFLYCEGNGITNLDMSGCNMMDELFCANNNLTQINLDGCSALAFLECGDNKIPTLDVSDCAALEYIDCLNNPLGKLDFSQNVSIPRNSLIADGNGYVSYKTWYDRDEADILFRYDIILATPEPGSTFEGWYDNDDNLISTDAELNVTESGLTDFVAVFSSSFIPPDSPTPPPITPPPVTPPPITPPPVTPPEPPKTGGASISIMGFIAVSAGMLALRKRVK